MSLEAEELDRRIQAWIEHGADEGEEGAAEFGELAVELFAYQVLARTAQDSPAACDAPRRNRRAGRRED